MRGVAWPRIVCEDAATLAQVAAELVYSTMVQAVATRGVARIALSGGSTPRAAYQQLARLPFERGRIRWFWVDERSVPPSHERSNYAMAQAELLGPGCIPAETVFRMAAECEPITRAASDYGQRLLREFGMSRDEALRLDGAGRSSLAFDMMVVGMGPDGHTASLFPGTGAAERDDDLVVPVQPRADLESRLSLTRPILTGARRILLLCTGADKREMLARAREPGSEDQVPARIYQRARSGSLTVLVDRAVAG
ncbi:6-phosphogluconolactonase [Myxococcota bacterium]